MDMEENNGPLLPKCQDTRQNSDHNEKCGKLKIASKIREIKLPVIDTQEKKPQTAQKNVNYLREIKPLMINSRQVSRKQGSIRKQRNRVRSIDFERNYTADVKDFILQNSSCYQKPLIYSSTTTKIGMQKVKPRLCLDMDKILHDQLTDSKNILSNIKVPERKWDPRVLNRHSEFGKKFSKPCHLPRIVLIDMPKGTAANKSKDTFEWDCDKIQTIHTKKWWAPEKADVCHFESYPEAGMFYKGKSVVSDGNVERDFKTINKGLFGIAGRWMEKINDVDILDCELEANRKESSVSLGSLTSTELKISPELEWLRNDRTNYSPSGTVSITELQIPDEISVERISTREKPSLLSISSPTMKFSTNSIECNKPKHKKRKEASLSLVNIGGYIGLYPPEVEEDQDSIVDEFVASTNDTTDLFAQEKVPGIFILIVFKHFFKIP